MKNTDGLVGLRDMELKYDSNDVNLFFTSDTHFWHTNIIKYCNRPFIDIEEMNEEIIKRWNDKVGKDDIVFHLGDFAFCGSSQYKTLLERLNGKITLILGNHDWRNIKEGYISKFNGVYQQLRIKVDDQRIYLNHFPFLCYEGSWRGVWQLFGHVHSGPYNSGGGLDYPRLKMLLPGQYDVGVDNNNFTPISYKELCIKVK